MKQEKGKGFLLANYYAFLVTGILVLTTGAIMPYLLRDYHLDYSQGGTLLMIQAAGNLFSGAASGILSSYIGKKMALLLGTVSFVLGFGGILLISDRSALFLLLFVSGLGWGTVNNLCNALVSTYTRGNARSINLLHTSFGIGAFLAPFLAGLFINTGLGWRYAVALTVILSAVLFFVFLKTDLNVNETPHEKKRLSFSFLRDPRFYVFMGILFFYVGSENSLNGWLTTYLIDSGLAPAALAQTLLSLFWISMIAGRLFSAWISRYVSKELLLLSGSLASILFIVLFLLSGAYALVIPAIVGLGISLAGIYPNTVANASYLFDPSGAASGLLFSCGGLGASVIPYFIGLRAQQAGIKPGMQAVIIPLICIALLCTINRAASRKKKPLVTTG